MLAKASEVREDPEDIFPQYFMRSDVFGVFISTTIRREMVKMVDYGVSASHGCSRYIHSVSQF